MGLDTLAAAGWLNDFAAGIHENADLLTDLDREIGDADHGSNMDRGMRAVANLDPSGFPAAADYLKKAGMTLVSTVGGASGPLYGTFFLRVGTAWVNVCDAPSLGLALRAGLEGILQRGKASLGDKTLVDALSPALDAYDAHAGEGVSAALAAAAQACAAGRDATIPLVARKGRASYLGERSAGHQDPGATSMTLLIEAASRTLS
ncbi:MAG: dihydroxyacetone kinase subunit L [Propionibacteriaceae bacterium]|jgi:dihydroxyacetone kinase phosphoprotein-dependent L subunit|nr:dihydroxyacetone kinase subunit L [Propionibacteriaceae bacterium]